jgi:hypothetical protein
MLRTLMLTGTVVLAPALAGIVHAQAPGGLPAQASSQAEVLLEGELEVHYEDSETVSRLVHHLRVGSQRLAMVFEDGEPPGLGHGTRVRVRGRRIDDTLSLGSGKADVEPLGPASSGTFGEQRTLVMLVNFQDNTSTPYSWTHAHVTTFQTVSDFYLENSYGQTWFTGEVAGWFTIPMTSASCDYYKIADLAEKAAAGSGVNLSQYSRRIIAFPKIGACNWWGMGNVGGNPSRAWINGSYALHVVAHELGHNLGDYHSRSQPCSTGGCSTVEYGDDHDVMGNVYPGHLNAFQKERLGWLNYGESPPVQTVTASGTYLVDAMSVAGLNPKALKILKGADGSGNRTWYYLEARAKAGFDSGAAPGVLLHTGSEASGNSSYQIDLAPTTSGWDGVLDVGQVFADAAAGVSFRTLAAGSAGATIEVTLPGSGPGCTTRSPQVSLSPSGAQTIDPGESIAYGITILNNDDAGCASTEFGVSASGPAGWSLHLDRGSVTVSPGTSAVAVLTVTPASDASGTSSFTVSATRTGSSGPAGSASGTITISTGPTAPGPIQVSLSIAKAKGSMVFTAQVQSDGSPVQGASLLFRVIDPAGTQRTMTAVTGSTGGGVTKLKLRPKDPKGTYQVEVTAAWGGSTASATGSFVN